jgi:hypothetical protein
MQVDDLYYICVTVCFAGQEKKHDMSHPNTSCCSNVAEGSPADRARIRPGDILIALGTQRLEVVPPGHSGAATVQRVLQSASVGEVFTFERLIY